VAYELEESLHGIINAIIPPPLFIGFLMCTIP
jgi:hypothetical protein